MGVFGYVNPEGGAWRDTPSCFQLTACFCLISSLQSLGGGAGPGKCLLVALPPLPLVFYWICCLLLKRQIAGGD